MERAGIAELKARLSEYLAKVKAGQDVLVTERGRPVARIVPVNGSALADEDAERARLAAMEREGLIRLGAGNVTGALRRANRPKDPDGSVRAALVEERREGR